MEDRTRRSRHADCRPFDTVDSVPYGRIGLLDRRKNRVTIDRPGASPPISFAVRKVFVRPFIERIPGSGCRNRTDQSPSRPAGRNGPAGVAGEAPCSRQGDELPEGSLSVVAYFRRECLRLARKNDRARICPIVTGRCEIHDGFYLFGCEGRIRVGV